MASYQLPVIQSFGKNVLWEKQESAIWHKAKNLLHWWHFTAFLLTVIDPSRSFRMTTDAFLIIAPYRPRSFWMDARMLFEKGRKRNSNTEWRIYYLEWHLAVFLTTVTDPSLSLQDDAFRSPSLWRFPFPITSDALSFNRHSERRQKCCSRKTGNGIVTRSEESITLNDILRFSSSR